MSPLSSALRCTSSDAVAIFKGGFRLVRPLSSALRCSSSDALTIFKGGFRLRDRIGGLATASSSNSSSSEVSTPNSSSSEVSTTLAELSTMLSVPASLNTVTSTICASSKSSSSSKLSTSTATAITSKSPLCLLFVCRSDGVVLSMLGWKRPAPSTGWRRLGVRLRDPWHSFPEHKPGWRSRRRQPGVPQRRTYCGSIRG